MGLEDLAAMLRYTRYQSYGPMPTAASCTATSHFNLTVNEMLKQFAHHIRNEANRFNIDGRAIAGAIAWEYEKNKTGRYSDYWQYYVGGKGIGWGSVHSDVAEKFNHGASASELRCLRMKADTAITLVAEIMDDHATNYFDVSGGIWIRCEPSVLAMFFNSSESFLRQSAATRKTDPGKSTGVVKLTVSQNKMGLWVHQNLGRFVGFRTVPKPPSGPFCRVKAGV